MIIIQRATKIGNSLWLHLPNAIKKFYKIKAGNKIEIDIKDNISKELVSTYRCKKCLHVFDSDEDDIKNVFCTACECEDVERLVAAGNFFIEMKGGKKQDARRE